MVRSVFVGTSYPWLTVLIVTLIIYPFGSNCKKKQLSTCFDFWGKFFFSLKVEVTNAVTVVCCCWLIVEEKKWCVQHVWVKLHLIYHHMPPTFSVREQSRVEVWERPENIILTHITCGLQMLTFPTSLFISFWLLVANSEFCVSPLPSVQTTCKLFFPPQTDVNRTDVCVAKSGEKYIKKTTHLEK